QREIDKTTLALELSVRYGSPVFYNIPDVSAALKRAQSGGVMSLDELIRIRRLLAQVQELYSWFGQIRDEDTSKLSYLFEQLFPDKSLLTRLETSIASETELTDDASAQLRSIRLKISRGGLKIRESLDRMIKSSSVTKYLQESVVTLRDGRFVLPVKTEYKSRVPGLVHDTSATGSTLFIEPMSVVEANNEIRILKGEEQDEIIRIIRELSDICAASAEKLISGYNAAAELDVYFSKANLAADMTAMTPEISDDGIIILNKARHPLLDKKKAVPINFSIGEQYKSLVITGPNTGGKTVVLKTVGLLTLMTMCGLLIPASDGSRISIYKKILVDIGDMQSIEHNLSTFSSHMNRVKEILDEADSESLVLLDELGSGTDPVEGAALAVAIIERIGKFGATLVTTTHYQELKMYALDTEGVENASCEFDTQTLKPTYRLIIGSPGKSNAFDISRSLGIDDDIIRHAKSLITEDNRRFENVIERLEQSRTELEASRKTLERERKEAEKIRAELETEREKLYDRKERELEQARLEAENIVRNVRIESQHLVEELEAMKKEKDKADFSQKAAQAKGIQRRAINKLYDESMPEMESRNKDYVLPRPLKKGDKVILADNGRRGILTSVPDASGSCFVQIGIMRTKVDASKLRLIEEEEQKPVKQQKKSKGGAVTKNGVESRMTRKLSTELDIRGYAADEGVHEVDQFISDAIMSGVSMLTIIHGRGTGVLKNAVRNHLKRHRSVKSYRPGVYGEGEDGVTIVELK
ncbi:MAG: endonuclease MutS2, partial [Ruminococcus sp.]|nr:endonuclease MutS2 [Ruminococcus sp.]